MWAGVSGRVAQNLSHVLVFALLFRTFGRICEASVAENLLKVLIYFGKMFYLLFKLRLVITASILGSQRVYWETSLLSCVCCEFRLNVRSVKDSKDPEAVQTLLFVTNKQIQQNLFDFFLFLHLNVFRRLITDIKHVCFPVLCLFIFKNIFCFALKKKAAVDQLCRRSDQSAAGALTSADDSLTSASESGQSDVWNVNQTARFKTSCWF